MSDPFLGQIIMFGGNFAPRGWALCDGQLLPISQYSALFSILGTTYGGDGRTTFALPDMRGRVSIHAGNGPGLSDYQLGQKGGSETNTLTTNQLPSHNHHLNIYNGQGSSPEGSNKTLAGTGTTVPPEGTWTDNSPNATAESNAVASTGGGQPVNNIQPYLTVNYIIALQGVFPSRS